MKHLPHALAHTIHEEKDRVFKPGFWFLYGIEAGGALAVILLLLVLGLPSLPLTLTTFLVLVITVAIVALPVTVGLVHQMRVEVETDIVSSTDYWGIRRSRTWAEIEAVESVKVFGFPYLKVHSFRKDRRPIYIPLYLANNEAFREKVIRTASPLNPLRQALESRTGRAIRTTMSG